MDRIKVAEALVDKIKREYADDISIVALCGSYVYNDIHDKSDLDFYFIPKTQRGYEIGQTFLIDGITFDFWGLSWERAADMANYGEENVSIIVGGQVIYYASDEDLKRFHTLQTLGKHISKEDFHKKAVRELNEAYALYFNLLSNKSDLHKVKSISINILRTLAFSIALLNCTCIKRGWGKLLSEIMAMDIVPQDFDMLYINILKSYDCTELIKMSEQIILSTKESIELQSQEETYVEFADMFNLFYEEAKSYYNKIIHACEIGDYQTVVLTTASLENLIIESLETTKTNYSKLPNLLTVIDENNLKAFIGLLETHEKYFVYILKTQNINITSYEGIESFLESLTK